MASYVHGIGLMVVRMDSPEVNVGISRRAAVSPSSINVEARTVEIVWTTGARVLRGFFDKYYEELSLDRSHVRMERLTSGATPLLDSHRSGETASVIGVIEDARIEHGQGIATVRFGKDEASELIFQKVADGILRNVSVGYVVHRLALLEDSIDDLPVYRAVDWEPMEISMVPIGADAQSQVRTHKQEDPEMKNSEIKTAIQADRERSAAVQRLAGTLNLTEGFAQRHIATDATLDQIRAAAFDEHAERAAKPIDGGGRIENVGSHQSSARKISLMSEALASRFGGKGCSEEAAQYRRLSTVDYAQHCLESRGTNTRLLTKGQIVERALHSTSDFPELLLGTGQRILREGYEAYLGGVVSIAKQTESRDFRPIQKLQLGEAPGLLEVGEGGEYQRGTIAESNETYSLSTFGRIFALSRHAIVNDDLGAFAETNKLMGRTAAEHVASSLTTLLTSNPTMADGNALFHANHSNLDAGGSVIAIASLGTALAAMRRQKGLDGVTAISVVPRYLVVPATQEVVARQVLTSIAAATVANANPFADMNLELIVDPRLDDDSTIAWYLAADSQLIDTIEYAYLEGTNGPEVLLRDGFDVDGLEIKVRLDFGSGVIDHRGLYKNNGA